MGLPIIGPTFGLRRLQSERFPTLSTLRMANWLGRENASGDGSHIAILEEPQTQGIRGNTVTSWANGRGSRIGFGLWCYQAAR